MKKIIIILVILLAGASAFLYVKYRKTSGVEGTYDFVEVTRGDLESTISSTGTLNPVSTIQVGTQVSGIIDKVYVDFNANVKKGQILAELDRKNLITTVRDAEAGLLRARAQSEQAQADLKRNESLYDKSLLSDQELVTSKTQKDIAQASLQSAESSLERAKTNLDYAVIRSPISGKVIFRNVEAGQTVAASFSTPTLFNIAEDLSRMEIHALVDESDIGQIREKQPVRFTVAAYPDKQFNGTVRQMWLQPTTVQNVVNYTVVVDGDNSEGVLLPGMTATVEFIIDQKKDVLLAPNSALRFQPTPEMLAEFRQNMQKRFSSVPDSLRQRWGGRRAEASGLNRGQDSQGESNTSKDSGRLWFLDDQGNLSMRPVHTGSTDGRMTEIVRGRDIHEGLQVISGFKQPGRTPVPTGPGGPGGPGGMRRLFF